MLLDVDPQDALTKIPGQRNPHDLPLTLANDMNDVVSGTMSHDHPEIMHHREGFDFVPGSRSLSAGEMGLVNVMSRETVLRQYVDSVEQDYDYVALDCWGCWSSLFCLRQTTFLLPSKQTTWRRRARRNLSEWCRASSAD